MDSISEIPAKTFLAGEYLALQKKEGLIVLTKPGFKIQFESPVENSFRTSFKPFRTSHKPLEIFHPDSPAGLFYKDHSDFFNNYKIQFSDPFKQIKKAGVGASTAQFLSLYRIKNPRFTDADLISTYLNYFSESLRPSGLDLLAQNHQNLVLIEGLRVHEFQWPFKDISFLIFFTGVKLNTHEHLSNLKNFQTLVLEKAFLKIKEGLNKVQSSLFVEGLQVYHQELDRQGFLASHTQDLLAQIQDLKELKSENNILASKGCGAMGSDTFVLIVPSQERDRCRDLILEKLFKGDSSYFLAHEGDIYVR